MSSTVGSTGSYSSSSSNRVTGLVSGIDVDSTVKQLMSAEKQPLNKLNQKKQLMEWKQDACREVSNTLRAFNDKYFSYSNSSSNLLSQTNFQQFSTASSDSSVVAVSASSEASAGSHTILVGNLATAAAYTSSSGITKPITGSSAPNFAEASGLSFALELDGTSYNVSIESSVTDINSLQLAVDKAVGSGKIAVSDTNADGTGYLTISKAAGSGIGTITLSEGDSSGALSALGFSSSDNLSNFLDPANTLEEISNKLVNSFSFDSDGNVNLTINGVGFSFSKSTALKEMMKQINGSEAGVSMKYSAYTDSFSITADNTGAGNMLELSESGSTFLQDAGITNYTAGEDAVATIDGEEVVRSSNSITLDGLTYSLKAESAVEQTVTISRDTEAVYNIIKNFADDYNSLISELNDKISEEYDRDYQPLTDDQKDEMSEDEIASWEEKAKTGLLEDDSTLENLLSKMRSALYQSVSGVSVNLTEVGITTSSNYEDKGKLEIDEDKLKQAIEADPEGVMNLFSQQSATYSGTSKVRNLTSDQREIRTSEEGLAYRIYDLLQDNISTYTDRNGSKGALIEKAGLSGDGSEDDNIISKLIAKYDEEIDEMVDELDAKEDYYYEQYSRMETYLNQMNIQLNSLSSYLE